MTTMLAPDTTADPAPEAGPGAPLREWTRRSHGVRGERHSGWRADQVDGVTHHQRHRLRQDLTGSLPRGQITDPEGGDKPALPHGVQGVPFSQAVAPAGVDVGRGAGQIGDPYRRPRRRLGRRGGRPRQAEEQEEGSARHSALPDGWQL